MKKRNQELIDAIIYINKWMRSKEDCFTLCMELEDCIMKIQMIELEDFYCTEDDEE